MTIVNITDNKSSINYGSTVSADLLKLISISGSSTNYPFGYSEHDVIEKAFYDQSGNLLNWSVDYPNESFTQVSGKYINLRNQDIFYSFNRFSKSFETIDSKVVLFPADDLKSLGYETGAFKCVYQPLKNIVGNSNRTLTVTEISNSRRELKLSYKQSDTKTKDEYINYIDGNIKTKEIVEDIVTGLKNIQLTDYFQLVSSKNREQLDIIKQKYSFSRDNLVLLFAMDLYNGVVSGERKSDGSISVSDSFSIKEQTINNLYSTYESNTNFDEIKSLFNSISTSITETELRKISNSDLTSEDINFFVSIFNLAFGDISELTRIKYTDNNYGLLKDVLNFGELNLYNIVNKAAFVNELTGEYTLLILTENALDDTYKAGSECYISNTSPSFAICQTILLLKENIYVPKSLRGPNFSIHGDKRGPSDTKLLSESDIYNNESGSVYNHYKYNKSTSDINVDYTKYENFVKFSSLTTRIDNFDKKILELNSISQSISLLDQFTDIETVSDISTLRNQRDEIIGSFDGYESYLYKNTGSVDYVSASYYDKYNNESLENNVPAFIREDENNYDYIKFVRMIGHMFDNIWIYIDNIPSSQPITNDGKTGKSSQIISTILDSFGWDVDYNTSSESLLQMLFSKEDAPYELDSSALGLMSQKSRTESVLRRMLINLPIILKTLGTEESIRSILSCYGVPKSIIKIREYGGISNTDNSLNQSTFKLDSIYHAVKFSNGYEYIKLPWDNSEKSIEFKLRFDPYLNDSSMKIYRLVSCGDRWTIGVSRENVKWGRIFFSISNLSETKTVYTDRVPIFNGSLYNVLIRKFDSVSILSNQTSSMDLSKYEIITSVKDGINDIFRVSGSIELDQSFDDYFQKVSSTGSITFGNFLSSGSSDAFYGNIDQIKTSKNVVSDDIFDIHSGLFDSFNIGYSSSALSDSVFRLNFEYPVNLYSTSSIIDFNNSNLTDSNLTCSLNNFSSPTSTVFYDAVLNVTKSTEYPYQFERFEEIKEVVVPKLGGVRYNSNKVRKIDITLETPLSPQDRAISDINNYIESDNNNLGVYLSPTDTINDNILKLFAGVDFQSLIGNPSDLYSNKYQDFEDFKRKYQKYISKDINFTTFLNSVKGYVDQSLFDQIKRAVPARTNLVTGILIEPTIFERTKIESKPLESSIHNNLNFGIEKIQNCQSYLPFQDRIYISIPQATGKSLQTNYSNNFIDSVPDNNGYGIFAQNGYTFINGELYFAEIIKYELPRQINVLYKNENPTTDLVEFRDVYLNGNASYQTKTFEKISIKKVVSSTTSATQGIPLNGYWHTHHKNKLTIKHADTKRISTTETFIKNQQTSNTTTDGLGNLNGDLPFYSTIVDRGRVVSTLQDSQNILST